MVTFFVYALSFANGKLYIGMSRTAKDGSFNNRMKQHAHAARTGKSNPVYNAWRKHGAPVQVVISTHETREECAVAEIEAIAALDTMNPAKGYNVQPGGQGMHAPPGSAMYDLMRAKVWNNPAVRAKLSAANKGKPPSALALSASAAARTTDEGRARLSALRMANNELRARLSAATTAQMANGGAAHLSQLTKGRPSPLTPEQCAAHSDLMRERMNTPDGKRQARRARAAAFANPENVAKFEAGRAAWRESDANRENCKRIAKLSAAACSRPVRDDATGTVYPSQRAMAAALGVSDAAISLRIKRGKATRM